MTYWDGGSRVHYKKAGFLIIIRGIGCHSGLRHWPWEVLLCTSIGVFWCRAWSTRAR